MKPILKFFAFIIPLVSLSCNKQLELLPENSLTFANAIQTEKDIEDLVLSVANTIRKDMYNIDHMLPVEGISDENDDNGWANLFRNNPIVGTWEYKYKVINQANIPLMFMDQTNTPDQRKKYYRGTLLFYKALAYLEIIRMWGDAPLVKDDLVVEPIAKSSWTELADYGISLAEEAVQLLPEFSMVKDSKGAAPINKAVPSKGAAYAVLGYLCSWKAGCKYLAAPAYRDYDENLLWKKADSAFTAIINSGEYQLVANPEEVCSSVLVGGSRESIYEVAFRDFWHEMYDEFGNKIGTPVNGPFYMYQSWMRPENGMAGISISPMRLYSSTVKSLYPPSDLRRYVYFYKLDSLSDEDISQGYAFPWKFRKMRLYTSGDNIGRVDRYDQNFIVFRLADILLMRAECRVRTGDNGGAITDLNTVRARAQAVPYDVGEGELRYSIFKERIKELFAEPNYYYYDIIRNGYVRTELQKYNYDQLSDQDVIEGALFNMVAENAFLANPLMRQNTYWNRRFN